MTNRRSFASKSCAVATVLVAMIAVSVMPVLTNDVLLQVAIDACFFVAILVRVSTMVIGMFRRGWGAAVLRSFAVATCLLLAFLLGIVAKNRPDRGAMSRGDELVQALRSFHSENGVWPTELGELVPEYIGAIPSPSNVTLDDTEFEYVHFGGGDGWYLGFPTSNFLAYGRWNDRGWRRID